jgi:predicted DNA-binding transcriptional regulator YafY
VIPGSVEDVRASRLIQLLLVLQTRGRTTAARLAEELEVSVRTIYRDVESLGAAGVPVYAESGPGGGVELVQGFRTRLTGLTSDEAEALSLSGVPGAAAQLGLGTVLAAAQLKVDAALPPELRARAVRVRERFLVDAPGWSARDEDVPALPVLAQAVWDDRRVDLTYRRGDRTVRRRVDPLGLVVKAGTWYLLARAGRPATTRTYRVSRVGAARPRDERFERPADLDLAGAWAAASAGFTDRLLGERAVIRVRSDALRRLRRSVVPAAADHAVASAIEDSPGWLRCELPIESAEVAHDELLRMGAAVEVLEPPELRQRMVATAVAMREAYVPPRSVPE